MVCLFVCLPGLLQTCRFHMAAILLIFSPSHLSPIRPETKDGQIMSSQVNSNLSFSHALILLPLYFSPSRLFIKSETRNCKIRSSQVKSNLPFFHMVPIPLPLDFLLLLNFLLSDQNLKQEIVKFGQVKLTLVILNPSLLSHHLLLSLERSRRH